MCVTQELSPESSLIKENKFPPLTCTGQGSDLNKTLSTLSNTSITTDFTILPTVHESTPIKPKKEKENQLIILRILLNLEQKDLSYTETMLQRVTGKDLLVQTYDRARKKIKSMHSLKNLCILVGEMFYKHHKVEFYLTSSSGTILFIAAIMYVLIKVSLFSELEELSSECNIWHYLAIFGIIDSYTVSF